MSNQYIKSYSNIYDKKQPVIKKCPFCGGRAFIEGFDEAIPYETDYYYAGEKLSCSGCGANFTEYKNEDEDPNNSTDLNPEARVQLRKKLLKRWNVRKET